MTVMVQVFDNEEESRAFPGTKQGCVLALVQFSMVFSIMLTPSMTAMMDWSGQENAVCIRTNPQLQPTHLAILVWPHHPQK